MFTVHFLTFVLSSIAAVVVAVPQTNTTTPAKDTKDFGPDDFISVYQAPHWGGEQDVLYFVDKECQPLPPRQIQNMNSVDIHPEWICIFYAYVHVQFETLSLVLMDTSNGLECDVGEDTISTILIAPGTDDMAHRRVGVDFPEVLVEPAWLLLSGTVCERRFRATYGMAESVDANRDHLYANLVPSGGNTLFFRFWGVHADGISAKAPFGIKMLASFSTFDSLWWTKEDFEQSGPGIIPVLAPDELRMLTYCY
ncbi:hypothetical protein B0H16DRAFT_1467389 [Mycena metata]|uniref:Uncharacterized protein n=1 Tax=Mycena metata TaxID=1033252 RepID=A0AAD7I640_9AGAR|nr:hypothetical protein B0H16DRAFT_1467389 [Mycena metata]